MAVVWSDGLTAPRSSGRPDPARWLLARAVAALTGGDLTRIHVVSRCSGCGSTDHGRPRVVTPPGEPSVWVSVARSGAGVAVACCTAPVGVDLERTDDPRLDDVDSVALAPNEVRPVSTTERARLWVRKEAVLKALGTGLTCDPRRLRIVGGAEVWTDGRRRPDVELCDLEGPSGYALGLCVLSDEAPVVTVEDAASSGGWCAG